MKWSDKQKAYDLARDAKGINEAVSDLMKFCVGVTEERDELKSQIHEITKLLNSWENGSDYEYFIATCDVGTISDFDIIRHIIDTILKPKGLHEKQI